MGQIRFIDKITDFIVQVSYTVRNERIKLQWEVLVTLKIFLVEHASLLHHCIDETEKNYHGLHYKTLYRSKLE
jgi:hypothetical protein